MGRHLSFAHCAANILVHISFADVRDFLQGMYAGVEWLGERVGPTFQGRLYQFTPSTSLVQCSCGIIFSPPFGILTLKFFFALNFIFWGKRSLGLHCLAASALSFSPLSFPMADSQGCQNSLEGWLKMKVSGPHTQKVQCNQGAVFFTSSQEILMELALKPLFLLSPEVCIQ